MADDTRERYINPYTDFGSKKVFWDNYSVMKTQRDKGLREVLPKVSTLALTKLRNYCNRIWKPILHPKRCRIFCVITATNI